ncbi:MAG: phosphatase PAP2 family protein [Gammaproteobacteria bacterium]|nr:phosphatase PAP2 family protein [Gammaproteobacteria bacterium]
MTLLRAKENSASKLENNTSLLFLLSISLLILLSFILFLFALHLDQLDQADYWHLQVETFLNLNHLLSTQSNLWFNLTQLGDAFVLLPLFSCLIIWRPQAWAAIFAAVPLAAFLSWIGKLLAAMPRPAAVLDHTLFNIVGPTLSSSTSLPSGHTLTLFAVITAVSVILLPQLPKRFQTTALISALSLALFLSLSRVAVGAHWPLDLLVGAALGIISGVSGALLVQKQTRWQWLCAPKQPILAFIMLLWALALLFHSFRLMQESVLIIWPAALSALFVSAHLFGLHAHLFSSSKKHP